MNMSCWNMTGRIVTGRIVPGRIMTRRTARMARAALIAAAGLFVMTSGVAMAEDVKLSLSGNQEVPAVSTAAKGEGVFKVSKDGAVSGSITTSGMEGVAAHIHEAPSGQNGPPIISLAKTAENVWSVPEGSKLTGEQYAAFKAGNLYVNVHSPAHKSGEIRAQLKP